MNPGDKMDPVELGHLAIDVKTILQEHGYVMPQGSVAKLPLLPGVVQAEIDAIEIAREKYATLSDSKAFDCPYCGDRNVSSWRKDVTTDQEFLACGSCHSVVEVR